MVAPSHVTTGAHPHQPRRWTARTTGSHSVKYSGVPISCRGLPKISQWPFLGGPVGISGHNPRVGMDGVVAVAVDDYVTQVAACG